MKYHHTSYVVCCLFGTKPLSKPMMTSQSHRNEQTCVVWGSPSNDESRCCACRFDVQNIWLWLKASQQEIPRLPSTTLKIICLECLQQWKNVCIFLILWKICWLVLTSMCVLNCFHEMTWDIKLKSKWNQTTHKTFMSSYVCFCCKLFVSIGHTDTDSQFNSIQFSILLTYGSLFSSESNIYKITAVNCCCPR